jgi:uncharacterized protein YdeI (YjbR/CyaY-like superfamily)
MPMKPGKLTFFKSQNDFRKWLNKNGSLQKELWVGFYRVSSSKGGITYPQALDEALCFGWIDGMRKGIDAETYTIRFSPRKPKSIWSAVNIKRVGQLSKLGLMQPAGLKEFESRDRKAAPYSHENRDRKLDAASVRTFKANAKAWRYFQAQAPWYQRVAASYVVSAKKEETRQRRLAILIRDSENERRIGILALKSEKK